MNLKELEQARRAACRVLGTRYYKMTKRESMEALVQANKPQQPKPWPFPR